MNKDFLTCPKCFSNNWNDIPNIKDAPELDSGVIDADI